MQEESCKAIMKVVLIMTFHIRLAENFHHEDFVSDAMSWMDLSTLSRQALSNLRQLKPIKRLMMPHISDLRATVIANDMLVGGRMDAGGNGKFREVCTFFCSRRNCLFIMFAFYFFFGKQKNMRKIFIYASANRRFISRRRHHRF